MIAPKITSHVQPSGRDYSGTTSPDLITEVPKLAPQCQAGVPRAEHTCRFCGAAGVEPCTGVPALELLPIEAYEAVTPPSMNLWRDEGRTTVGGALMLLAACFIIGFLFALAFLGAPTSGAYQGCIAAFQTEIGAVTAMDELDCRDGLADGRY